MLRQQDVGHRIVVRRIVEVRGDRTLFSDALGELVELTDSHLTVLTARGPLRVPLAQVHRAKRVPPARRPSAEAVIGIEVAANEAWPAPVQDRLGGWLLRAADGWTGRGNSALPIGDPDRPLPEAIEAVQRWYAQRGQRALINVPLPLATPIGAALDEQGWLTGSPVLVQTARLTNLVDTGDPPALDPPALDPPALGPPVEVRLSAAPSAQWLTVACARLTAHAPHGGTPQEAPALRHLLTAVPRVMFVQIHTAPPGAGRAGGGLVGDDPAGGGAGADPAGGGAGADPAGELLAVGRGTVTGGGRWLGLTLLRVLPHAQRRGLGQLMVRALARWAAGLGATDAFLQVEEANAAAVALYRRLGFRTHHTYVTRRAPT